MNQKDGKNISQGSAVRENDILPAKPFQAKHDVKSAKKPLHDNVTRVSSENSVPRTPQSPGGFGVEELTCEGHFLDPGRLPLQEPDRALEYGWQD